LVEGFVARCQQGKATGLYQNQSATWRATAPCNQARYSGDKETKPPAGLYRCIQQNYVPYFGRKSTHVDKKCGGPLTDPSYVVVLMAQDNAS
jgi:hypothetical protein